MWIPKIFDNLNDKNLDTLICIKLVGGKKFSGNFKSINKSNKSDIYIISIRNICQNNYYNMHYDINSFENNKISSVYINNSEITRLGIYRNIELIRKKLNDDTINKVLEYLFPDLEYL